MSHYSHQSKLNNKNEQVSFMEVAMQDLTNGMGIRTSNYGERINYLESELDKYKKLHLLSCSKYNNGAGAVTKLANIGKRRSLSTLSIDSGKLSIEGPQEDSSEGLKISQSKVLAPMRGGGNRSYRNLDVTDNDGEQSVYTPSLRGVSEDSFKSPEDNGSEAIVTLKVSL